MEKEYELIKEYDTFVLFNVLIFFKKKKMIIEYFF